MKIRLILKSFCKHSIISFIAKLYNKNILKKSIIFGQSDIPISFKKFSILRSPHVHSTSREQYEFRTYTKLVDLQIKKSQIQNLFKIQCPSNVHISIMNTNYYK